MLKLVLVLLDVSSRGPLAGRQGRLAVAWLTRSRSFGKFVSYGS
jgi:hypothetical protein